MACGYSKNYILVDNADGLQESLRELKSFKSKANLLAVDCEGVKLSREGELTIVTVATEEKAYIFDVVKLKKVLFDEGLREILEDKSREKLMFDCRQDSDSLWHQYQVKLTGVLDVQLLEVMKRREEYGGSSLKFQLSRRSGRGSEVRRSDRGSEVEKIRGFNYCLELYTKDTRAINTKDKGRILLQSDRNLWKRRPISDVLLRYCAVDTLELFKLYNKLKSANGEELSRLRLASERYTDLFRGKAVRSFDQYEGNGFLPLDVIPSEDGEDNLTADTLCNGCKRLFPQDEFSEYQLRHNEQKCRVCSSLRKRKLYY
ncbi:piRNA biogenesis protein EXD1 [Exaiptasia diaphana]|uniref:3'-5' exonuclease domain-containing protein n=1 Tax=Exaiptasia diaphana TaxID=2652724 RepID=A0A913Y119_EXADI|nr:piRNA biogenesis protein EXD1 [Exaiptasia diaphana]